MKVPRDVAGGLILAVALDTALQIFWKLAVKGIPDHVSAMATARAALSTPYFYIALLAFPAQLFNWTRVLARADLSFAQPITSLGFITVLTLSRYSLHERISSVQYLGVLVIFLGIFFITRTPHETTRGEGPK